MNKSIASGTVLALFVLLFLTGCGGDYSAERMYWHVQRKHTPAISAPGDVSGEEFAAAAEALDGVVTRFPHWRHSADIQFRIGTMYAAREEFDRARREFEKVYMNFPQNRELSARALFAIGRLYEVRDRWSDALPVYNQVMEQYEGTVIAMQLPLYIGRYYQQHGMIVESENAYDAAIRRYANYIELNPYGENVPVLQNLILIAYGNQGKWDRAAGRLTDMAENNPESQAAPIALYRAARIYGGLLNRPERASELYRKIIDDYPRSVVVDGARWDVGNLSILQGNIEEGKQDFENVFESYPEDTSLHAMAQLAVARGYEREGNWEQALIEYRRLQEEYPDTIEAMRVPLLIASRYMRLNMNDDARRVLEGSVEEYDRLINSGDDRISPAAYDFKARVFAMQRRWNEAISVLESLRRNYPDDHRAQMALLRIGTMYQQGLNDQARAREAYLRFTQEYPHHRMSELVREITDGME